MIDLTAPSGGIAIGDLALVNERGTDYTDTDGKYYLRTGLAKAITGYETAASLEHCKVSGIAATNSQNAPVTQVADNGAGVIVACYSDATNVLVSTNYGATWANVAHNLGGGTATAVVWNGTRFIVGGCSGSTLYTSYSTTGGTFTVGANQAATATAGSIRGAWSGTVALFVAAGGTAACFSTTDGVTLTARTLPASMTAPISIAQNGAMFLVGHAATSLYSTTNGAAFTTRTPGLTNPVRGIAIVGGLWLVFQSTSPLVYFTSSDLSAWAERTLPTNSIVTSGSVTSDGTRVYAGAYSNRVLWSIDGISWKFRTLSATTGANGWHIHAGICALPVDVSQSNILRIPAWATADYVGTADYIQPSSTSGAMASYVRLK